MTDSDTRNVADRYKGQSIDDIRSDLNRQSLPLQIAIENLQRDFNMGTIVRTANAFNVSKLHIIGSRQWNKRGAMKTDAYMNIDYHSGVDEFAAATSNKHIIAVDIVPGAKKLSQTSFPKDSILVFGAEGPGLSDEMLAVAEQIVQIEQFGSTRSINVGVAAGIAMYAWVQQHVLTH